MKILLLVNSFDFLIRWRESVTECWSEPYRKVKQHKRQCFLIFFKKLKRTQ